ncbi:hypothetical protein V2J09_004830 [Rumex salicifolius]
MASSKPSRTKPSTSSSSFPAMNANLCTTLFFVVLFTIPALFLLRSHSSYLCNSPNLSPVATTPASSWSGDLRRATFPWNRLSFQETSPHRLRVAVFSRKWPTTSAPGGMERHAYGLHMALSGRGHDVHVFTSPADSASGPTKTRPDPLGPTIHCHEGVVPGQWRYNKAWDQFVEENKRARFDVVHSESVALPHHLARHLPNLAVSWHGIALESLQSSIFQDLTRPETEPMSPGFNDSIRAFIPKVLNEIRFFHSYTHHVAISDSCGEMLRDVYQIPNKRVHVILNGVSDDDFKPDPESGSKFRSKIGLPKNATLVLGVAGRLVKDKGHPLLYSAFSKLIRKHPSVYLVVAGAGPWGSRYRDLGPQVLVLGSMSPSELGAFYNAIDVFVNPTMRPQGLDLTLMEAMMSGKPVMASRFPSIKGTIVVEEEFGFMFAPNVAELEDALEEAVGEGAVRLAERGRACRRYADGMFTARKMALAYERLFLCVKNETFCTYP